MGEYAEMMLDGTLCEGCGTFIDSDGAAGFPRYCSNQCARDRGALHALPNPTFTVRNPDKVNCRVCGKRVKQKGMADHIRDRHPVVSAQATAPMIAAARELFELAEDAIPILDVLIEDRENAIGEECEIARDLRDRCIALVAKARGES